MDPLPGTDPVAEQLALDRDTLGQVLARLKRFEAAVRLARSRSGVTPRGYFTPDEDDRVRQLLCSYRGLRIACYEIIQRWWNFAQMPDRERALEAFLVGYATALTLYSKSLLLIQTFERDALVRKKLNEPDSKFDLAPGFFEELIDAYSAPRNLIALSRAHLYWVTRRRDVQRLAQERAPEYGALVALIRAKQPLVRKRLWSVIRSRVRHDAIVLTRTLRRPFRRTRFGLQMLFGAAMLERKSSARAGAALHSVLAELHGRLRPGDVLLVRAEGKLTTALVPGFWAHAAIFFGGRTELEELELGLHPFVQRHWERIPEARGPYGQVLEAISPRVAVHPLERCLAADHVAVLRPRLSRADLAAALGEAFGHMGKAYDFEFDFRASSRIVCTELVWRAYHQRGRIGFRLVKRLGRFTLTPDDIVEQLLAVSRADERPFEIVALALHEPDGSVRLRQDHEAENALRALLLGWRPASGIVLDLPRVSRA